MALILGAQFLKEHYVLFNTLRGQFIRWFWLFFQLVYVCAQLQLEKTGRNILASLPWICIERFYFSCLYRAYERIHVSTQVQSSSSVLILRVLTVSIESSWQLKEERKIGKWGGVSMLRPLPPHSSLAEGVWIYSGNVTFDRNKWEGSSFLCYVWIPSSDVSLSDAVWHKKSKRKAGVRKCTLFLLECHCVLGMYCTGVSGLLKR